jgi:hypothetical protein
VVSSAVASLIADHRRRITIEIIMKITKRQLRRIIKEEHTKLLERRRAPDAKWWATAFHDAIADQIGWGEPSPEQRAAILAGLQLAMDEI